MTQIYFIRIKQQALDCTDCYGSKRICVILNNPSYAQTMRSQ